MAATAAQPAFIAHCVELFSPLGSVRARRMFGGWGIYLDELFIAIVAFDRLFLKANAETLPAFEAAGCEPFHYTAGNGQTVSLGYRAAPAEALDAADAMAPWARLALQAALAARAAAPATAPRAGRHKATRARRQAARGRRLR